MKQKDNIEIIFTLGAFFAGLRGADTAETVAEAWRIAREKSADYRAAWIEINGRPFLKFYNGALDCIYEKRLNLAKL